MKILQLIIALSIFASCSKIDLDILIINGTIVDGSGDEPYKSDIGIINDRIVRIGDLSQLSSRRIIDANNLVVSPGFIDSHTHAIRGIFDVPTAESSLLQGVTTLTDGNDGTSPFPIDEHYQLIENTEISPNWSVFVGQGTIRQEVMGLENRDPTASELSQMKVMVKEAMEEGALGISTGLFYVPGSFSSTSEVIELSKVASHYGGIYISHMREEAVDVLKSINETINIGIKAQIPVQITHHKIIGKENWGLSNETLKLVDNAIKDGVKVSIDQYPYTASQTSIRALIPQWAQAGGRTDLLQRIEDPSTRKLIIDGIIERILFDRGGGHPKNIFISKSSWNTSLEGKNLAELCIERDLEPSPYNAAIVVFEIIKGGGASAVYHAINSDDVDLIMQHPMTSIASDGPMTVFGIGSPHPRTYGTFARVLGSYVRDRNILSLEEAVRKMTSLPAQILSIDNRGLIQEGYYADITIFDASTVTDKATFEDPHQYAEGIYSVLVNGVIVVENGAHNGSKPGRVLRGPGYKY
ncbi:D-aminoacylase [Gammaproteobacteria bacterium]|nr:D-aminoacylase [Gammaproteobacteria bacterium]MDB9860172.1 D-aminoacylase [Gammaproteobacteria bacterium]MDB9939657.1 D-aminoacylase [Gammaproteobacteria bacterium]